MKQIYSKPAQKVTFTLALFVILFFAGLTRTVAQEVASVNSNANVTPALMLSFTGIVDQTASELTWVTENETSAKWFIVERSASGSGFDSIGKVMGQNNQNMTTYNYSDDRLSNGSNYYRLREVDNDGVARYSKIISLNNTNVSVKMQVYPNPASAIVNFAVNSHSADVVTIQIFNLSGALVAVRNQEIGAGLSQQTMAISNLKTGSYILKVSSRQGMQSTQVFSKI